MKQGARQSNQKHTSTPITPTCSNPPDAEATRQNQEQQATQHHKQEHSPYTKPTKHRHPAKTTVSRTPQDGKKHTHPAMTHNQTWHMNMCKPMGDTGHIHEHKSIKQQANKSPLQKNTLHPL